MTINTDTQPKLTDDQRATYHAGLEDLARFLVTEFDMFEPGPDGRTFDQDGTFDLAVEDAMQEVREASKGDPRDEVIHEEALFQFTQAIGETLGPILIVWDLAPEVVTTVLQEANPNVTTQEQAAVLINGVHDRLAALNDVLKDSLDQ